MIRHEGPAERSAGPTRRRRWRRPIVRTLAAVSHEPGFARHSYDVSYPELAALASCGSDLDGLEELAVPFGSCAVEWHTMPVGLRRTLTLQARARYGGWSTGPAGRATNWARRLDTLLQTEGIGR